MDEVEQSLGEPVGASAAQTPVRFETDRLESLYPDDSPLNDPEGKRDQSAAGDTNGQKAEAEPEAYR
jgi:hypothetical protein